MQEQRFIGADGTNLFDARRAIRPAAQGLMVCPVSLQAPAAFAGGWVHEIYRLAYERAQAALQPTWYERNLIPCLN
jgi:hypothetical protein